MSLKGKKVVHVKFGKGTVLEQVDNKIQIDFSGDVRKFQYPNTFKKFMKFDNDETQDQMEKVIDEIEKKKAEQVAENRKLQAYNKIIKKINISNNGQIAFGFVENTLANVKETWSLTTGRYLSGASKGQPRIPKAANHNSACLLTVLPSGEEEKKRQIVGTFMVKEDFRGRSCLDGVIESHDCHRIMLDPKKEKMLFWDYFDAPKTQKKWGNVEIKYFENIRMKKILQAMNDIIKEDEKKEKLDDFYKYYCYLNNFTL